MASPSRSSSEANQMVSLFLAWARNSLTTFFLVVGNYIDGRKSLRVHTEIFFRQIADVAETRHHLKIVAKEALDGFGLRRALHDH